MSGERWDVVLRALNGPRSREGEFVARGPVIRMGAKPGSGGVALEGYRGLDDRQAVVTVYEDGRATIQPVGNSQVRLAPHEHVDWAEVLPLTGPAYLTDGAAIHLGPNGRGATLCFVTCQPLGAWEAGQIKSRAAGAVPGITPTDVVELDTGSGRPAWFMPMLIFITSGSVVTFAALLLVKPEIPPIGPKITEREVYEIADVEKYVVLPELEEGLNQPFHDFVMEPNADVSGRSELLQPDTWDKALLDRVNISVQQHASDYLFWMRLDTIVDDYALVVETMRDEGLPEVFAGIPYTESQYRSEALSPVCAGGYWQFMPEVGNRAHLVIRDCKLHGSDQTFTPTDIVIPGNPLTAIYVGNYGEAGSTDRMSYYCRLNKGCAVDERRDIGKSTVAAAELLAEAFLDDDEIRDSGAAVQMTIASHNCGYNDGKYGRMSNYNVLPAFQRWKRAEPTAEQAHFVGKQILCTDNSYANHDTCGSYLPRETQHYTYPIIASHFLAVCYYASNYGREYDAFEPWQRYLDDGAYCSRLNIPTAQDLKERGG